MSAFSVDLDEGTDGLAFWFYKGLKPWLSKVCVRILGPMQDPWGVMVIAEHLSGDVKLYHPKSYEELVELVDELRST